MDVVTLIQGMGIFFILWGLKYDLAAVAAPSLRSTQVKAVPVRHVTPAVEVDRAADKYRHVRQFNIMLKNGTRKKGYIQSGAISG